MYCKHCGKVIDNDCIVCPNCGKQVNNLTTDANKDVDKSDCGLSILSFLIPLAGLIIMCVNLDKKPKMAKECGIMALAGFMFGILILPLWSCAAIFI